MLSILLATKVYAFSVVTASIEYPVPSFNSSTPNIVKTALCPYSLAHMLSLAFAKVQTISPSL